MSPLIKNYPTYSPPHTTYLPLTRNREYLSLVDQISDGYLKPALEFLHNYKETDFFQKKEAIDILESCLSNIKSSGKSYFTKQENETAHKFLDQNFRHRISTLTENPLSKIIYQHVIDILLGWQKLSNVQNPRVTLQPNFVFCKEDFQIAGRGSDYEAYCNSRHPIFCHSFAFYKLNETNAYFNIFNAKAGEWHKDFFKDPVQFLRNWDYALVDIAKPGDLVVYCSTLKGYFEVKHTGVCTSDGRILSKFGLGEVYKHPLEDVILGYGTYVYFLHKEVNSPFVKDFINELEAAKKELSHPAMLSPISPRGCVLKMIDIFKQMKLHDVFTDSIYNEDYNLEIKANLLGRLRAFSADESCLLSKENNLNKMKEIALIVCEQVRARV